MATGEELLRQCQLSARDYPIKEEDLSGVRNEEVPSQFGQTGGGNEQRDRGYQSGAIKVGRGMLGGTYYRMLTYSKLNVSL